MDMLTLAAQTFAFARDLRVGPSFAHEALSLSIEAARVRNEPTTEFHVLQCLRDTVADAGAWHADRPSYDTMPA